MDDLPEIDHGGPGLLPGHGSRPGGTRGLRGSGHRRHGRGHRRSLPRPFPSSAAPRSFRVVRILPRRRAAGPGSPSSSHRPTGGFRVGRHRAHPCPSADCRAREPDPTPFRGSARGDATTGLTKPPAAPRRGVRPSAAKFRSAPSAPHGRCRQRPGTPASACGESGRRRGSPDRASGITRPTPKNRAPPRAHARSSSGFFWAPATCGDAFVGSTGAARSCGTLLRDRGRRGTGRRPDPHPPSRRETCTASSRPF